jgi:cullin 1
MSIRESKGYMLFPEMEKDAKEDLIPIASAMTRAYDKIQSSNLTGSVYSSGSSQLSIGRTGFNRAAMGMTEQNMLRSQVQAISSRTSQKYMHKAQLYFYLELIEYIEAEIHRRILPKIEHYLNRPDDLFGLITKEYRNFKIWEQSSMSILTPLSFHGSPTKDQETYIKMEKLETIFPQAFRRAIYEKINDKLCAAIMDRLCSWRMEKDGFRRDLNEVITAIEIFVSVGTSIVVDKSEAEIKAISYGIYVTDFETPYIEELAKNYTALGEGSWSVENGDIHYLEWAQFCIQKENELARRVLKTASLPKINDTLTEILLVRRAEELIKHPTVGLRMQLEKLYKSDIDEISKIGATRLYSGSNHTIIAIMRMFEMFRRVPNDDAIKIMASVLGKHVFNRGTFLVNNLASAEVSENVKEMDNIKQFIEDIIDLNESFNLIIDKCFFNDPLCQVAKKEAFVKLFQLEYSYKSRLTNGKIVEHVAVAARVLSQYCNWAILGDIKSIVPENAEVELKKLVDLTDFIVDADIFADAYWVSLATRLIRSTAHSEEVYARDSYFIGLLQNMRGKGYVSKMISMMGDRSGVASMNQEFKDSMRFSTNQTDFSCSVLTPSAWPEYKRDGVNVPVDIDKARNAFHLFYRKLYSGRKLEWIDYLATATVSIKFRNGNKEIDCSGYQAIILSMIAEAGVGGISAAKIAAITRIDIAKVKVNIATMYISSTQQLLTMIGPDGLPEEYSQEKPKKQRIDDTDVFVFNEKFTSKQRKFKLNQPVSIHREAADENISEERKHILDAAIVRIMKARRTLQYNDIVELVVTQVSKLFIPKPRDIKRRIDELITKEFLKRDPSDPTLFHYLA